ncbi:MAG: PAS domain S-box protein [Candidatus Methanoperedens sp.]|nr:PAS domain S-box protein [Candidatus Methanoperedens sp.]MCZ7369770.1 PAS domain S-box protein [Candidatus Methanoperedens sp.]
MKKEGKTKNRTTIESAKPGRRIAEIEESETEWKRIEETLQHRIDMEELIAGISTSFINISHDEIDCIINHSLQKIGEFADVDRSYVFQLYNNGNQMDNTHEWFAEGIEPQIRNLKRLIPDGFPWFMNKLTKFEIIHVPNVIELPSEACAEKETFQMQGIKSLINVPMVYENSLVGFLGFDSVRREKIWPDEDIRLLKMMGEILVNALEHKRAEEKLKRSEEKYRDLFENANDAICVIDAGLKYKDVNKKTVEMLGYSREELLNMSVLDIIPPAQISRSEIEFNKLRKKGSYEKFVGKARTKDGGLIDVEVSSSAIKEEDKIIGSRDIIRDITERMKIEEALRESEERYRTIIEYSNDMIWTLDTEGRFLFFNKSSGEITGLRLEDWRGKSFAPLIEKEDLPKVIDVFQRTLSGEPEQYEVSVKKEDGNLILLVNTAPIYSKGKVVGTVSFGRDITERKKAEEHIKESLKQELRRSNKQKKLLYYLIEGTRGGKTRALILTHLSEKSYNAHQLAVALNKDYKTIRHHLEVLVKNGIIIRGNHGYSNIYFISKDIAESLNSLQDEKLKS